MNEVPVTVIIPHDFGLAPAKDFLRLRRPAADAAVGIALHQSERSVFQMIQQRCVRLLLKRLLLLTSRGEIPQVADNRHGLAFTVSDDGPVVTDPAISLILVLEPIFQNGLKIPVQITRHQFFQPLAFRLIILGMNPRKHEPKASCDAFFNAETQHLLHRWTDVIIGQRGQAEAVHRVLGVAEHGPETFFASPQFALGMLPLGNITRGDDQPVIPEDLGLAHAHLHPEHTSRSCTGLPFKHLRAFLHRFAHPVLRLLQAVRRSVHAKHRHGESAHFTCIAAIHFTGTLVDFQNGPRDDVMDENRVVEAVKNAAKPVSPRLNVRVFGGGGRRHCGDDHAAVGSIIHRAFSSVNPPVSWGLVTSVRQMSVIVSASVFRPCSFET